jgi:hypothetical protein
MLSLTTPNNNEWISLSTDIAFGPCWTLSLLIRLERYGVMSIDDDNTCNNDGYSRKT